MPSKKNLGLRKCADPTKHSGAFDLVFVHGLTGDSERTWREKESDCFWPRDLVPTDLSNARIFTYGYDADIVHFWGQASQSRINDHANTFLSALANQRLRTETEERPLMFVAHSMGGLLVEDLLLASKNSAEPHLKRVLDHIVGIAFLGTPFCGSQLAAWGSILGGITNLLKKTNVSLVEVLQPDSEVLARIQHDFHSMIRDRANGGYRVIEITCFFEELVYPNVGIIVPKQSATLPGRTPIGIHADHVNMTKFGDAEDPGYQAVIGELWRWSRDAQRNHASQHASGVSQFPTIENHVPENQAQKQLTQGQPAFNSYGNTFQNPVGNTGTVFQGSHIQSQGDMRFG